MIRNRCHNQGCKDIIERNSHSPFHRVCFLVCCCQGHQARHIEEKREHVERLIAYIALSENYIAKTRKFLKNAEKHGHKIVHGAGMLVEQGALAFELWTGQKPSTVLMLKELNNCVNP